MDKIIIVGGGGHAKVVISILKRLNNFEIVGYTDTKDNGPVLDIPYLGPDQVLEEYKLKGVRKTAMGIGQLKDHRLRMKSAGYAENLGYKFPAIVAPTAIINEDVEIERGTVIMDSVVINPGVKIGAFCIINTKASVDHDCQIGQYVHIAPGVTMSGSVKVGDFTLIGTGASVIQEVTIEESCIIGAGAAVMRNCQAGRTYIGNPAGRLRLR